MKKIIKLAMITLAFSLIGMTGVARQEAYQLFNNASGIFYAVPYLAMFSLPFLSKVHRHYRAIAVD